MVDVEKQFRRLKIRSSGLLLHRRLSLLVMILLIDAFSPALLIAQEKARKDLLQEFIKEGFARNLVLQQKNVSLEKAMLALRTAKSMYLPNVELQAGYQTAEGGRQIPLPIGDMLNGVYATLNQLTGSSVFPQIANQTISFLPHNFYDAKIRTTVPIINTDLGYNKSLSEQKVKLQSFEVDIYKRELVKDIKAAYYNYLSALQGIGIYRSSLALATEGKRVNEKLLEGGKGLPAYVIRANSEIASSRAQLVKARQQANNARMYFNVLLNREADTAIDSTWHTEEDLRHARKMAADNDVHSGREEIKSLEQAVIINETLVKMNKKFMVPKLNGFVDIGSQAENWKFNNESRYYMAGVQLSMPLFSGGKNQQKIRQASLDLQDAELVRKNTQLQLDLSSRVALNNLKAAIEEWRASEEQLNAAQTYQRLIDRGYSAGANTYIETIDARNQLTAARLALNISKFNVLQAAAGLERETASFNLDQ